MPRVTYLQTNFTAGELSPRLLGRTDIARYANAVELMENAFPLIHGGATRRSGTKFVKEVKTSAKQTRLIPYVFSRTQAYILEFGDQYMRVYMNGGQVETSPGVAYEITTPYTEAMLDEIDYVQGADTMFVFHPTVPIYRLRRYAHDDWSLAEAPFDIEPFAEIGTRPAAALTLSSAAVGTGRTFTAGAASFEASDVGRYITFEGGLATITGYTSTTVVTCTIDVAFGSTSIASGDWVLESSPQTTCTPSAKDPVGATITLTLGAAGWRSADVGKFVKINGGLCQITAYTSTTVVSAKILTALTGTVASPANAWTLEATVWNAANGYPRTGTLFEQRLIVGGSDAFPQTLWGSKTGEYLNFQLGVADDDAFQFALASDQVNPIAFLTNARTLIALTYGGEFTLQGGVEKPITPTNVQVRMRSNHGCAQVRPVRIRNEEMFIQRAGKKLRSFAYNLNTDDYNAPDMSVLAEHITGDGVVELTYQQEPESIMWALRSDGVAATMTFDRDQDVIGWARQTTDGVFESIATIPTADSEQTWVIVRRTINGSTKRYIEVFDSEIMLDCAIVGTSGPGAATWSNLTHLEGKSVSALADGIYVGEYTVTAGEITLPRTANAVTIGLNYTTTIELLTPEMGSATGSAQGNAMRSSEVTLRLHQSIGGKINDQVLPGRSFGVGILDQAPESYTGLKRVELLGWERGQSAISIVQDQPYPFTVLAVIRKFTAND